MTTATQYLLPFREFHVPAWALHAFRVANACAYPERKYWFYPFKEQFLKSHAVTDGLDLQMIHLPCGCGDGIWRGCEYTLPRRLWQTCDRCGGTAIWKTVYVVLQRWSLAGHTYHTRADTIHTAEDDKECFRTVFTGRIQHTPLPVWQGRATCLALLLAYQPATGRALLGWFWREIQAQARLWLYLRRRAINRWLSDPLPDDDDNAISF